MTHDELLARIDKLEMWMCERIDTDCDDEPGCQSIHPAFIAFRAVVELHKPHEGEPNLITPHGMAWQCIHCRYIYPCPTIQAIEGKLK